MVKFDTSAFVGEMPVWLPRQQRRRAAAHHLAQRTWITSRMSLLKVFGLSDGEEMPIFQSERGRLH
jgi:hypothetical protein